MAQGRQREIRKLVEAAGLTLGQCLVAGSGHYRCAVMDKEGRQALVTFPTSPSDWRGSRNKASALKRFAAGEDFREWVIGPSRPDNNKKKKGNE